MEREKECTTWIEACAAFGGDPVLYFLVPVFPEDYSGQTQCWFGFMKHWHCDGGQQLSTVWLNISSSASQSVLLSLLKCQCIRLAIDYQCRKLPSQTHGTLPWRLTFTSNPLLNSHSILCWPFSFMLLTTIYILLSFILFVDIRHSH